ncbi:MAG: c-type cytochrome [Gammaproteobacteria bacterium]|nr:c-type cytochrome [Gammaproteobacteria bacterium]
MKRSTLLQAALLTCGLSFSAASFAGASGAMLGNTCAGCHGTNGISNGPASPSLAGLDYDYLVDAMKSFKEGERRSTIMSRIAKGYSDEEIEAMSKFFADKKYVMASQTSDAAAAKRGKKLHLKYCKNCHGDTGVSSDEDDDSGMLSGQWKPYMTYTFADYLAGEREMGKKMKKKFSSMHKKAGDKGIKDLLEFYASQK